MKTILLIDDNVDTLENLSEYFELEGYKILVADNGYEGLQICNKFMPDIIICDIRMDGINGYEVLQQIINTPMTSAIPFIFSTSMSEKKDKTEALKLGADDYIIKPYEPEDLLRMILSRIEAGSTRINISQLISI